MYIDIHTHTYLKNTKKEPLKVKLIPVQPIAQAIFSCTELKKLTLRELLLRAARLAPHLTQLPSDFGDWRLKTKADVVQLQLSAAATIIHTKPKLRFALWHSGTESTAHPHGGAQDSNEQSIHLSQWHWNWVLLERVFRVCSTAV